MGQNVRLVGMEPVPVYMVGRHGSVYVRGSRHI